MMNDEIIGRADEQAILRELLSNTKSDLLAIYGKRRVGKTYLVKTFFKREIVFECSGAVDATTEQQLNNFALQLRKSFNANKTVKLSNWQQAFVILEGCMNKKKSK